MDGERIISAAILHKWLIVSITAPGRHNDIIRSMGACGLSADATTEQGFLTSIGRFVSRRRAMGIAELQGQIKIKTAPIDQLFSEDLW